MASERKSMESTLDLEQSEEIVKRLKLGDEKTYQVVIDAWHHRIFNYALRYSNDRYFAKEVVQKTFIQMFEKIDQLKDPSKLRPWLYRIASNCCASEGRRRSRGKYTDLSHEVMTHTDRITPATQYEDNELRKTVKEVLQLIPNEQRKVIIMKEYEGLKFREIAEILGESENTVKSRMYYGLDAMKKIIEQKNIDKRVYHE